MTNLNDLAKQITLLEGKDISLSIAQVKEVLKITFTRLAEMDVVEVGSLLKRYKKN